MVGPAAFGARPSGDRAARVAASPQYRDGKFRNPLRTSVVPAAPQRRGMLREFLFGDTASRRPAGPVPLLDGGARPAAGDALTWYGHASTLVEIDGARVLLDPVWSKRCSPSQRVGPRRLHPPPVPLPALPPVDAVVISHDHYDHLDMATIRALARDPGSPAGTAPFVVPLGVGAHLSRWGVPDSRIVELDWGEEVSLERLRLVATAARHFSGRTLARDYTLWGSWVIAGPTRRVFYTGDSGYFDGYAGIGERYGPFDANLIQVGAYDVRWPEIHMTPEEAVTAHLELQAGEPGRGLLVPVHWATFVLAFHAWGEPVDRLWREAKARDVALAVPRPGERIDLADPPPVDGWWQSLMR
ncbi:MAG: MBL fold metallo-hydrolase [Micromonosporaceae bacterium]|nr:MBL fold metallo-hydrolase [Micromonosporaceae bacterium]